MKTRREERKKSIEENIWEEYRKGESTILHIANSLCLYYAREYHHLYCTF